MSLEVGAAIKEMLLSDNALTAKIGDRLFPVLAKENTSFPFVIYKRSGLIPAYTKDKYSVEDTVFIDVVTVSDKYVESLEIANIIRNALERKRGTFAGIKINDIRLANSDEDGEDVFAQGLSFEVIIEKK